MNNNSHTYKYPLTQQQRYEESIRKMSLHNGRGGSVGGGAGRGGGGVIMGSMMNTFDTRPRPSIDNPHQGNIGGGNYLEMYKPHNIATPVEGMDAWEQFQAKSTNNQIFANEQVFQHPVKHAISAMPGELDGQYQPNMDIPPHYNSSNASSNPAIQQNPYQPNNTIYTAGLNYQTNEPVSAGQLNSSTYSNFIPNNYNNVKKNQEEKQKFAQHHFNNQTLGMCPLLRDSLGIDNTQKDGGYGHFQSL